MQIKAIIFDVDGTIANTERYGHLPACNDAFKSMDLPIEWDWEYFKTLMKAMQGNANRLRRELESKFDLSEIEMETIISEFEVLKKEFYVNTYVPIIQLREGVENFIANVQKEGFRTAIVSTSYEVQIKELVKSQLPQFYPNFNPILGKESGVKTGNDGMLYEKCLKELGLRADECLVIEDSEIGLKASLKAGIKTIITYNEYTSDENFGGAAEVHSSLSSFDLDTFLNNESNLINHKL